MSDKKLSVAFIGTGIMGAPIAGHILDAGYPVTVYNRTKAKTDDLVSRGAVWADSPAAAAKDADVLNVCRIAAIRQTVRRFIFPATACWLPPSPALTLSTSPRALPSLLVISLRPPRPTASMPSTAR